jgi:hypothetical protein
MVDLPFLQSIDYERRLKLIPFEIPDPLNNVSHLCYPCGDGDHWSDTLQNTDLPVSPNNYDINRCDPNLSLFRGLFLKVYRHVRHDSIPFSLRSLD